MTQALNPTSALLPILRAAGADATGAWAIPSPDSSPPLTGSCPLATVALNAAASLLAGLPHESRASIGLIIGTTLGCLETDRLFDRSRRDNPRYASPAAFAKTLPTTIPAEIALAFHLTGPSLTLAAGAHSAALALRRAAAWMYHFNLPFCIAGGMDTVAANPATPEICRVALLLVGREGLAVSQLNIGEHKRPDLAALRDTSLDRMLAWIQTQQPADLGLNVQLNEQIDCRSIHRLIGIHFLR